jgi:hypothetical protein
MWTTQARCPHAHNPNNRHQRLQRGNLKQEIAGLSHQNRPHVYAQTSSNRPQIPPRRPDNLSGIVPWSARASAQGIWSTLQRFARFPNPVRHPTGAAAAAWVGSLLVQSLPLAFRWKQVPDGGRFRSASEIEAVRNRRPWACRTRTVADANSARHPGCFHAMRARQRRPYWSGSAELSDHAYILAPCESASACCANGTGAWKSSRVTWDRGWALTPVGKML